MRSIAYSIVLDGRSVVSGVVGNRNGGEIDIEQVALSAALNIGLLSHAEADRAEVVVIEDTMQYAPSTRMGAAEYLGLTTQDMAFLKGCQIAV